MKELLYLYGKMSYYFYSEPAAPLPSMRNSVGVFLSEGFPINVRKNVDYRKTVTYP